MELLYDTQNKDEIISFYEDLKSLDFQDYKDLEKFESADDYSFKYALLKEGYLIQRNALSLEDMLSVNYKLNEKGQKEVVKEELKSRGFKGTKSISKNYFESVTKIIKEILEKYNFNYQVDWGNYGVKTPYGHWIPKNLVDYLDKNQEENIIKCQLEIKEILNQYKNTAKQEIEDEFNEYKNEKRWISLDCECPNTDKIINNIINNHDNIKSLINRYKIVDLAFEAVNIKLVENLYDILKKECEKKLKEKLLEKIIYFNQKGLTLLDTFHTLEYYKGYIKYVTGDLTNLIFKVIIFTIQTRDIQFLRCLKREYFVNKASSTSKDQNNNTG